MDAADLLATQWLVFRLQARHYAVHVERVVEIVRLVALTPVPAAPPWLAGMLNLRGQVIPVLDLRCRLGLHAQALDLNTPLIVTETAGRLVTLIADAVDDVLTLPPEAQAAPDPLTGTLHPISAVARAEGRLILLLDLERVCAAGELFTSGVFDESVLQ